MFKMVKIGSGEHTRSCGVDGDDDGGGDGGGVARAIFSHTYGRSASDPAQTQSVRAHGFTTARQLSNEIITKQSFCFSPIGRHSNCSGQGAVMQAIPVSLHTVPIGHCFPPQESSIGQNISDALVKLAQLPGTH